MKLVNDILKKNTYQTFSNILKLTKHFLYETKYKLLMDYYWLIVYKIVLRVRISKLYNRCDFKKKLSPLYSVHLHLY